jgi:hypothetical protein
VAFSFTNRTADVVEKCFTRVDATEQFPFSGNQVVALLRSLNCATVAQRTYKGEK